LKARIVNALGGRAAEQIVYGEITTGAENDIKQVTDLARAMVTRFGMSREIGLIALSGNDEGNFLESGFGGGANRPYSDTTAEAIDRATKRIIDDCYRKAIDLLTQERDRLDALTEALLREESLNEEQMLAATGLTRRQVKTNPIAASR
jgi:cell division protease FtsH